MSLREWNEIVDHVGSTKIKERSDAVVRFRAFLQVTRHHELLIASEHHSWLTTLQALFHLVIMERNLAAFKPSAAVAKRLEDATSLLRWTVEKVHLDCSRKAIRAVLAHLTQMVAYGGKLQSFALTYLRTLRCLLQYAPHLEHLEKETWTDIVSLCFAGVLGDKIKVGLEFKDDDAMEVDSDGEDRVYNALRATDEDLAQDRPTKRTATMEDIELVSCIEASFRSKSAPFHQYSHVIFTKFNRLFRQFPNETTAHLPALTALNRAFAELDLNDQRAMRDVGTQLWPHIIALWATKSTALKEQVVMALKCLFPFMKTRPRDQAAVLLETKIRPLFDAVMTEPTLRWREGFELDLDHLRLGVPPPNAPPSPFWGSTYSFGNDFLQKHAVAWTVLELGADSLARLYQVGELAVAQVQVEEPNAKRRKVPIPYFPTAEISIRLVCGPAD